MSKYSIILGHDIVSKGYNSNFLGNGTTIIQPYENNPTKTVNLFYKDENGTIHQLSMDYDTFKEVINTEIP